MIIARESTATGAVVVHYLVNVLVATVAAALLIFVIAVFLFPAAR
jgi:hypothetical protein